MHQEHPNGVLDVCKEVAQALPFPLTCVVPGFAFLVQSKTCRQLSTKNATVASVRDIWLVRPLLLTENLMTPFKGTGVPGF